MLVLRQAALQGGAVGLGVAGPRHQDQHLGGRADMLSHIIFNTLFKTALEIINMNCVFLVQGRGGRAPQAEGRGLGLPHISTPRQGRRRRISTASEMNHRHNRCWLVCLRCTRALQANELSLPRVPPFVLRVSADASVSDGAGGAQRSGSL